MSIWLNVISCEIPVVFSNECMISYDLEWDHINFLIWENDFVWGILPHMIFYHLIIRGDHVWENVKIRYSYEYHMRSYEVCDFPHWELMYTIFRIILTVFICFLRYNNMCSEF